jgi:hypothetical protein
LAAGDTRGLGSSITGAPTFKKLGCPTNPTDKTRPPISGVISLATVPLLKEIRATSACTDNAEDKNISKKILGEKIEGMGMFDLSQDIFCNFFAVCNNIYIGYCVHRVDLNRYYCRINNRIHL